MAYQDLLKDTSEIKEDGNYFLVTVTDLEPAEIYPIQFRWQYKDKTFSEWSSVKKLTTPGESDVPVPQIFTGDFKTGPGKIVIYWNGKDSTGANITGIDRVNVYLQDENDAFGDGSDPVTFFKEKGTVSIAVPAGTYTVTLRSVTTRGSISNPTEGVILVVQDGIEVQPPTLPVGLSVASAPFALTVSWTGQYASETFTGFKSINIYASTTDLGSSTTTNISNKLVGSMTVDQTSNKITVGLDILKQVLSLTSTQAYSTGMYLYYVSVNADGTPYKVSGTTTYTRINSTAVSPTKANLVDLENGLISIENLVAGNGQFQSWLRTGTAGSSRIELSSANVNSSEAGGYQVLSGFTVYNSANSPVFRADLSGNVAFGGYTPGDIASISTTASGAATTASGAAATASGAAATASGAAATAGDALTLAGTANNRTKDTFNADGSEINRAVQLTSGLGAIYSNKPSWESSNTGWYLGYNGTTPVIDIGSADSYVRWNGSALQVKGAITATSGSFTGTITAQSGSITGDMTVGNVIIKPSGNAGGFLIEDSSGADILYAETGGSRLLLGNATEGVGRQVEVARSAQVAGSEAANSGGLRNMYTITTTNFNSNTSVYLSDRTANGDVLLVWTP